MGMERAVETGEVAAAVLRVLVMATVTVTVSESERVPTYTVSSNVRGPVSGGAVNVGDSAVASDNATSGPVVWVHEYDMGMSYMDDDLEPSSVAVALGAMVRLGPALAVGGRSSTVIVTVSTSGKTPSETRS